ncbi:MAG: preprotein translocase subunit SecG [Buchnera aphidicola (Chaetogeoica yunlongensis)]
MYNFFVIMFVIVDIFLVFLIMIQNRTSNETNFSCHSMSSEKFSVSFHHQNKLIYATSILSSLFFLISLIISNINYHESYENKILLHDHKKFFSVK